MNIYQAIESNDLEELQSILEKKVDGYERNSITLDSPLFCASELGNESFVEILLNHGFCPDFGGWTSNLNIACANENFNIVELLLSAGADPNYCVCDTTPLIEAAYTGNTQIIQLLINSGANVNAWLNNTGSAFSVAIHNYKVSACTLLLALTSEEIIRRSNLDVLKNPRDIRSIDLINSIEFDLNAFDEDYYLNPLISNAENGNEEAVKKLIDYGVFIDNQNKMGETALIIAAKRGNYDIVKTLLENGADQKLKDNNNLNALDHTLINNQKKWLSKISNFDKIITILS
jgi:ankyrin repeat protein